MKNAYLGASLLAILVAQAAATPVFAQTAPPAPGKGLEEIVVTAQKRSEKLQKVPMSIQVLDSKKLAQQQVTEFSDYAKLIPSLTFQQTSGSGPQQNTIYLRGVVDGGNANHSGPLPTVGSYLDEMPTTTIGGTLDVHIYDMARIEVLPGPQGTLYGASSESGTVRMITNKPTPSKFEAGYDIEGNTVDHGGQGFIAEGFVNIPLTDTAAVRIVGFDEHDAGFINNVVGDRTIPNLNTGGTTTFTNAGTGLVKKDFNPVDTFGGRVALGVDLNDDWNVLTTLMGQDQRSSGTYGYDPSVGYLDVQRFLPDSEHDRWLQGGVTVTGQIGDYQLTYAGGLFLRDTYSQADYSDYTVAYEAAYGSYWQNAAGQYLTKPLQYIVGKDHYTKFSNEVRLASPSTDTVHFIVGAYQEQQTHHIEQNYEIAGLAPALSVPNWPGTWWLTDQLRTDRDYAAFAEATWDINDKFHITAGIRGYYYSNTLLGFFGLPSFTSGCFPGQSYNDAPCVDLNRTVDGSGQTHKINLTYNLDPDKMLFFTYSTGYRPGGVNRRAGQGAYNADTLTNFELGFKSTWLDHRLTWNTALYDEDWDQFQFAFLGANSLTIIKNAPSANIKGAESAVDYRLTDQWELSGAVTLQQAQLSQDFCTNSPSDGGKVLSNCTGPDVSPGSLASRGNALPYAPSAKGNITSRYSFPIHDWDAHVQATGVAQSRAQVALRDEDRETLGSLPGMETLDLAAGIERNRLSLEIFAKNVTDNHGQVNRYVSCTIGECTRVYVVPIEPLMVGIKLSQRF